MYSPPLTSIRNILHSYSLRWVTNGTKLSVGTCPLPITSNGFAGFHWPLVAYCSELRFGHCNRSISPHRPSGDLFLKGSTSSLSQPRTPLQQSDEYNELDVFSLAVVQQVLCPDNLMKLSGSISALCLDREMLLGEACRGETAKYLVGYLKLLKINLEIHVDFAPSCFIV